LILILVTKAKQKSFFAPFLFYNKGAY